MIEGQENTLYEDSLLFFDIQIPCNYPVDPPKFSFSSFSTNSIHAKFLTDGTVVLPRLNTEATNEQNLKWSTNDKMCDLAAIIIDIRTACQDQNTVLETQIVNLIVNL